MRHCTCNCACCRIRSFVLYLLEEVRLRWIRHLFAVGLSTAHELDLSYFGCRRCGLNVRRWRQYPVCKANLVTKPVIEMTFEDELAIYPWT